ncbi:MAG: tRNA 2-thiocytidine biosynthesis TtcA family protein [Treponemataceae bacterium]|nr:MAG: tRNA 2-thiocytidine biosynthesis TtcA family protein [Treponemataceae bacterium]
MADRISPSLRLQKLVVKACNEYALIENGDKILIAVSGGKDSTCLAWALSRIKAALKVDYELLAVHISSDFCACCKKAVLLERLPDWNIPFEDVFVPIIGRLKPGRKMNCYWCSTQRRTELLRYAASHGCYKIALGHHLDDIIETYFMNLLQKGVAETMQPLLRYTKYPVSLIRPLSFAAEDQVIACADELGVLKAACTCPFGAASKRKEIRKKIADLTSDAPGAKQRVLGAIIAAHPCARSFA